MNDLRIELSSVAFADRDAGERTLTECRELCRRCGVQFGVQLHNTCDFSMIRYFMDHGIPLSAHAPVEQPLQWNLAAADPAPTWREIVENIAYLQGLGISAMVFHGFFMTDQPAPAFGHGRSVTECMREFFRPELARWPGKMQNRDFTGDAEYLERRERVKKNLRLLRERYSDLTICIENDYPAYGEGSMLPRDLEYYEHPLCLDTGHLWITSRLFGLDFEAAARRIIDTGRVKMMHLHASKYDESYPDEQWGDGHQPLSIPNAKNMRLRELAKYAAATGMRHFVLEIPSGSGDDVRILLDYLGYRV